MTGGARERESERLTSLVKLHKGHMLGGKLHAEIPSFVSDDEWPWKVVLAYQMDIGSSADFCIAGPID